MPDGYDDERDSSDAQREAVVEMANLTNGMMGGMFDRSREPSRVHGSSRPMPTTVGRVRAVSGVVAIGLAVLTVASPVILSLTVGVRTGVTVGLGVAALAAGIVYVVSSAAQRRAIGRRAAREEAGEEARP